MSYEKLCRLRKGCELSMKKTDEEPNIREQVYVPASFSQLLRKNAKKNRRTVSGEIYYRLLQLEQLQQEGEKE